MRTPGVASADDREQDPRQDARHGEGVPERPPRGEAKVRNDTAVLERATGEAEAVLSLFGASPFSEDRQDPEEYVLANPQSRFDEVLHRSPRGHSVQDSASVGLQHDRRRPARLDSAHPCEIDRHPVVHEDCRLQRLGERDGIRFPSANGSGSAEGFRLPSVPCGKGPHPNPRLRRLLEDLALGPRFAPTPDLVPYRGGDDGSYVEFRQKVQESRPSQVQERRRIRADRLLAGSPSKGGRTPFGPRIRYHITYT